MEKGFGVPKIMVFFPLTLLIGVMNSANIFLGIPGSLWISIRARLELGPSRSAALWACSCHFVCSIPGSGMLEAPELAMGRSAGETKGDTRHALRNCLCKKVVDIFQYYLLQRRNLFFFFPRAASLFESVRKAKKETKLEVWVQTAVSTGSTTYRLKQDQ